MTRKATHFGHCQVCGNRQMLPGNLLSLHGYTKEYGFFNGTCHGARHKPLEQDRTVCDGVRVSLLQWADAQDAQAAAYRAGTAHPAQVQTGSERVPGRFSFERRAIMTAWADCDPHTQRSALQNAAQRCNAAARDARAHEQAMVALAARIHGQPLTPVERASKVQIEPGTQVRLFGKNGPVVTVKAVQDKIARGVGPYLNGNRMPHIVYDRNGTEWSYPVRLIRQSAIVTESAIKLDV